MPSFMLWNPSMHADGGGCSFDVRPADFVGLERGTRELVDEFLNNLGIGARADDWTVSPFRCSYFAQAPDEDDWRDRYPRAWRVRVRFPAGQVLPFTPLPWGYFRNEEGFDSTWTEDDDETEFSSVSAVVIADFPAADFHGAGELGLDLSGVATVEQSAFAQGFVQVRFDLGALELPREAGRLEMLLAACRTKAASVHWQRTVHYIASTGQGIP